MSIPLPRRPAIGLGLSLLVHAAVLAWLAQTAPPPVDDAPAARMQVTLLRLPPPRPEAVPAASPPAPPVRARAARPGAPAKRPDAAARPHGAAEQPPLIMLPPKEDAAVATQPAPTQEAAGFDLQAARGAARAYAKGEGAGRGGADGKGSPMRATRGEKLGEAIERSRPADCRTAYAGLGVLAVIPLAASTVTGKGCKW